MTISTAQVPTEEVPAAAVAGHPEKTKKKKRKNKSLKSVLPTAPAFEMYKGDQLLDTEEEHVALKTALRAITSNLDKIVVDNAMAELFTKAAEIKLTRRILETDRETFMTAATLVPWTASMNPIIPAKVMYKFAEARRIAINFSRYRRYPVELETETKLAQAIDTFQGSKPFEEPEDLFDSFTQDQLDTMMGKILRREKADWGATMDSDGDDEMADA